MDVATDDMLDHLRTQLAMIESASGTPENEAWQQLQQLSQQLQVLNSVTEDPSLLPEMDEAALSAHMDRMDAEMSEFEAAVTSADPEVRALIAENLRSGGVDNLLGERVSVPNGSASHLKSSSDSPSDQPADESFPVTTYGGTSMLQSGTTKQRPRHAATPANSSYTGAVDNGMDFRGDCCSDGTSSSAMSSNRLVPGQLPILESVDEKLVSQLQARLHGMQDKSSAELPVDLQTDLTTTLAALLSVNECDVSGHAASTVADVDMEVHTSATGCYN